MEPAISTATQKIAEQGIVFAMFIIITYVLVKAVKTLYDRNQVMGDNFMKAFIDNTAAVNKLADQIERINDNT